MDDIRFSNSFNFRVISFKKARHTDATGGISCHFFARMKHGTAKIIAADTGETMEVSRGDIFYLPKGLRYNSYWTPEEDEHPAVEWESYSFEYFPCKSGKKYSMQVIDASSEELSLFDEILPRGKKTAYSIGMLYAFLGLVSPKMKLSDEDQKRELFSLAKSYMYEHPAFKVSELAKFLGMSESSVYAFFSSYMNTTPIKEKQKILANRAVDLLHTTDLSVEEIADAVGIQSAAYLRKIVKEEVGLSPSEIRKKKEYFLFP